MEHTLNRSHFESDRPWERFEKRDEAAHPAEDKKLFPDANTTSAKVIEEFLDHDKHRLDRQVHRRRQLLEDFLKTAILQPTGPAVPYLNDVGQAPTDGIALLDDRRKHDTCGRLIRGPCDKCNVYSRMISILELCQRLRESRKTLGAEKRIIFIPNLTSRAALALAATVARRSAIPVRNFLHRYLLGQEHVFSVSTSEGFLFEFQIPYHAMRPGPIDGTEDPRMISNKCLRESELLPLSSETSDEEQMYYHQAQTSSLCWGDDEYFWTELFLVDTYFGSEEHHLKYLTDYPEGDGLNPPLGGRGNMKEFPRFDPREYFLLKLDVRMEQVTTEYSSLIETFDKRMEEYAKKIRYVFTDDNQRSYTKTLSIVIYTINTFVDRLGGIIDSWHTFNRTEVSLFTKYAPGKVEWHKKVARIDRHVTKLDGLRKLLINKGNRFKFKLDSFHTVSSLSQMETANRQAETAVSQGKTLKMLTKMTVYLAFPLLFTTAFFGMDFVKPPYPELVSIAVFLLTSLLNYMIASQSSPVRMCKDFAPWARRVWTDFVAWIRRVWGDFREWMRSKFGRSGYINI